MKTVNEFMNLLFEMEVVAHIAHLQTTSYAQHMALDELYKGLPDLRDAFIEPYQGQYGIVSRYGDVKVTEGVDMVKYMTQSCLKIKEFRETLKEGYLQQLVDNILEFMYGVMYKLRFLH